MITDLSPNNHTFNQIGSPVLGETYGPHGNPVYWYDAFDSFNISGFTKLPEFTISFWTSITDPPQLGDTGTIDGFYQTKSGIVFYNNLNHESTDDDGWGVYISATGPAEQSMRGLISNYNKFGAAEIEILDYDETIDPESPTGAWYYITLTFDGSNLKSYVNSVLTSEISTWPNSNTTNPTGTLSIGNYGTLQAAGYTGYISEVLILNKALNGQEVSQLLSVQEENGGCTIADAEVLFQRELPFSPSDVELWTSERIEVEDYDEGGPIDTEGPVVTLVGDTNITIPQGSSWTDPGAEANDNIDASIDLIIEIYRLDSEGFEIDDRDGGAGGSIDTSIIDTWYIRYSTDMDSSGNESNMITRTVVVTPITPNQGILDNETSNLLFEIGEVAGIGKADYINSEALFEINTANRGLIDYEFSEILFELDDPNIGKADYISSEALFEIDVASRGLLDNEFSEVLFEVDLYNRGLLDNEFSEVLFELGGPNSGKTDYINSEALFEIDLQNRGLLDNEYSEVLFELYRANYGKTDYTNAEILFELDRSDYALTDAVTTEILFEIRKCDDDKVYIPLLDKLLVIQRNHMYLNEHAGCREPLQKPFGSLSKASSNIRKMQNKMAIYRKNVRELQNIIKLKERQPEIYRKKYKIKTEEEFKTKHKKEDLDAVITEKKNREEEQ